MQDKLNRSVVSQKGDTLTATDIKQSVLFSTCEYSQNDGRAVLFAAVVETTAANRPLPELEHLGDNWSFVKSGRGHGSQI